MNTTTTTSAQAQQAYTTAHQTFMVLFNQFGMNHPQTMQALHALQAAGLARYAAQGNVR